jgi:hypothetical protein
MREGVDSACPDLVEGLSLNGVMNLEKLNRALWYDAEIWKRILLIKVIFASSSALAMVPVPVIAAAADYPERSVRFIVPYTPGAINDFVARLVAQKLSDVWGKQVVVDNRAGGGTLIGTDLVAKANPDGYTMLLVPTAFAINVSLYPQTGGAGEGQARHLVVCLHRQRRFRALDGRAAKGCCRHRLAAHPVQGLGTRTHRCDVGTSELHLRHPGGDGRHVGRGF